MSESGRAVSAYHSMLIFNVLGTIGFGEEKVPTAVKDEFEQPLVDLIETYHSVTQRTALEAYHDAQQALDMAMNLFSGGYLPLEQRAHAENLFWAICEKISQAHAAAWTRCRRICSRSKSCSRTRTSATSRCSSRFPTAGRSSSCSR